MIPAVFKFFGKKQENGFGKTKISEQLVLGLLCEKYLIDKGFRLTDNITNTGSHMILKSYRLYAFWDNFWSWFRDQKAHLLYQTSTLSSPTPLVQSMVLLAPTTLACDATIISWSINLQLPKHVDMSFSITTGDLILLITVFFTSTPKQKPRYQVETDLTGSVWTISPFQ